MFISVRVRTVLVFPSRGIYFPFSFLLSLCVVTGHFLRLSSEFFFPITPAIQRVVYLLRVFSTTINKRWSIKHSEERKRKTSCVNHWQNASKPSHRCFGNESTTEICVIIEDKPNVFFKFRLFQIYSQTVL